jgi:hypothetical protein
VEGVLASIFGETRRPPHGLLAPAEPLRRFPHAERWGYSSALIAASVARRACQQTRMMTSNGDWSNHEARTMQRMKIQFARSLMAGHHALIQPPRLACRLNDRGLGGTTAITGSAKVSATASPSSGEGTPRRRISCFDSSSSRPDESYL